MSQLEKRTKVLLIFNFNCSSLHFGLVNLAVTLLPLQRVAGHLLVKGELDMHFGAGWLTGAATSPAVPLSMGCP